MNSFVLPVRVYLEDTDAQGVVYNASYFRFLERARTEWLRGHGVDHNDMRDREGILLVLVGTEVRFARPAKLDDMLFVSAELSKLKGARFIFDQTVRRDTARKPRRIPATLLSELTE
jgi:tol-pal system-associated acyl-CoA thioesterase